MLRKDAMPFTMPFRFRLSMSLLALKLLPADFAFF